MTAKYNYNDCTMLYTTILVNYDYNERMTNLYRIFFFYLKKRGTCSLLNIVSGTLLWFNYLLTKLCFYLVDYLVTKFVFALSLF